MRKERREGFQEKAKHTNFIIPILQWIAFSRGLFLMDWTVTFPLD